MENLLGQPPALLARALLDQDSPRAWLTVHGKGPAARVETSSPVLARLAEQLPQATVELDDHAALFLEACPLTGALFGAFLHRLTRGQGQGGLRRYRYATTRDFFHDGLRLSRGMSRKSALAGLYWGGGKGIIATDDPSNLGDDRLRARLYHHYGLFVSSLAGCYVTAIDSGTTPGDMRWVHAGTRHATCVSEAIGGSGNPSRMTARGVVAAIEAGLEHLGSVDGSPLDGKHLAMQGGGSVGSAMIECVVERGARVTVAEVDPAQCDALRDRFPESAVAVRPVDAQDISILALPCDVLVPNGLGGVLDDKTIPLIRARLVCGAANNQLADGVRHATALRERGVVWVPDFVANRMGIVSCADEHAGVMPNDRRIERHLDPDWSGSVHATTLRVLERAQRGETSPLEAAHRLADEAMGVPHPIFGERALDLARSLIEGPWAEGRTPLPERSA